METATTAISEIPLCEEKAANVMRWISESEDIAKTEFSVTRLFESGVLPENSKRYLHETLELQFPGDRLGLELPPEQLHGFIIDAFTKSYLYLTTPHSFLSDFLSFGKNSLTTDNETLTRLTYLIDYPYFPDMIDEWLGVQSKNRRNEIPKSEFEDFLRLIDHAVILYSTQDAMIRNLKPLYEFHNEAKVLAHNTINTFFEDKHLSIPEQLQKDGYTIEDTANALKEVLLVAPGKEQHEELLPEYGAFLKELRDIGVILPSPGNKVISKKKDTLLPAIQLFISEKLRGKCLEKMFHGNLQEYDRMVSILNSSTEYAQAELNLNTMLDIYKIEEDTKVARKLHKALRLRFNIPSPVLAD